MYYTQATDYIRVVDACATSSGSNLPPARPWSCTQRLVRAEAAACRQFRGRYARLDVELVRPRCCRPRGSNGWSGRRSPPSAGLSAPTGL